jgi:iron complex outermembrane recepter protein
VTRFASGSKAPPHGVRAKAWLRFAWTLALTCAASAWAESPSGLAQDIPPQPLSAALAAYARQTGVQLIYVSDIAAGRQSNGAHAGLAPRPALTQLLEGTGLQFEFLNDRSVRILIEAQASPLRPPNSKRDLQRSESLAGPPIALDQIVVSAASTPPPAFVPASRAVVTREAIESFGVKDLAALANLIPGIEFDSYPDYGAGIETNVAIRGVNALDGSTTAIYIDDVPVPGDRLSTFGRAAPLTFDLDRIEVLRGPQGVKFGEGAEGGVVRFITTQPDLEAFSDMTKAEFSSTLSGSKSYEAGAAFGGPLLPGVAGFRISAWSRSEGGYVNRVNPFTNAVVDPDANRTQSDALRVAFAVAPIDGLRLTPSVEYQSVQAHDTATFYTYLSDPHAGRFRNGKLLAQGDTDRHALASLNIDSDLSGLKIKSVTSYFHRSAAAVFDNTNDAFWFWSNPLGPEFPVSYADAKPEPLNLQQTVLTQRIGASGEMPAAQVSWLAAADFVRARYREDQDIATSALSDGGEIRGAELADRSTTQIALYGQGELHIGTRFTSEAGVRIEQQSYDSLQSMVSSTDNLPPLSSAIAPFTSHGEGTAFVPQIGSSFRLDQYNLLYATIAKGYRAGGANPQVGSACQIQTPASYGPDSLWNFELGSKNSLLDNRLQIDGSLFYMLWKDRQLQIPVPGCGFGYTINGGAARIDGFELALQGAISKRLTVKLTLAFADARYLQTVLEGDKVIAARGDALGALPLVPAPWSSTPSLEYRVAKLFGATLSLTAWDVFRSRNPGPFTTDNPNAVVYAPERRPDPSTNLLNVASTLTWPHLEFSLFVNNALNSQPLLQYRNRVPADTLFYATTFRPLTVGIAARWRLTTTKNE